MPSHKPIPFVEHLGIAFTHVEPGHAVSTLVVRPELENSWHSAHGGVIATLLDSTAAVALRALVGDAGVVTVDFTVAYLAPGRERLTCEARVLHHGARFSRCEAEVRSADGALVAKAMATFVVRRR